MIVILTNGISKHFNKIKTTPTIIKNQYVFV